MKRNPLHLSTESLRNACKILLCKKKSQLVELTFFDKNALTHYSWPGLKTVGSQRNAAEIKATIPYYGGTWLLQRLLALKGKVTTKDKAVMHAMRTYAASLLAAEEQL